MTTPVTRTIPAIMPLINRRELYTRQLLKASLIRRIAQAQNWIWSKFVRVYANHGYEGLGNILGRIGTNYISDDVLIGAPDGLTDVLPVCSFVVPPNWGASRRLKVQGRLTQASAGDEAYVLIALYNLTDEAFTGIYAVSAQLRGATSYDWSITMKVPQDKMYQCKVLLRWTDASSGTETDFPGHNATMLNVSGRYDAAIATELGEDDPVAQWQPTADLGQDVDHSLNAAILTRITDNLNYHFSQRGPEVCQSWLGDPNCMTSTFTEVGRYTIWLPDLSTEITGKLHVFCTHGGAGNEVRVKVDGTTVQTFTVLAAGENLLSVTAISALADASEHTITIEAKSTAASADWGTSVWGVAFWESAVTLGLPGGTTVPSDYQPLDETGDAGDEDVIYKNNRKGQHSGVYYLIQNDRWLARHRLRWLIGDWRHRVYKRVGVFSAPNSTVIDPRIDWTPGPPSIDYQMGRPKNITVMRTSSTYDDKDGYGNFPYGVAGTSTGYSDSPFFWPSTQTYTQHGDRLAKHWMIRPSGTQTHLSEETSYVCVLRGRRLQPGKMVGTPTYDGPVEDEPQYWGKAYFQLKYNTGIEGTVPIRESSQTSLPAVRGTSPARLNVSENLYEAPFTGPVQDGDYTFAIRGRLPSQAFLGNNPQGVGRPEGSLFEVELCSMYLADEPLNSQILKDL